jgi:CPA2 family monovalent cation:H+ antiporter-2
MVADSLFFRDLAYVFAAVVVGGFLARLARQPLVLGYVLGGILVSPLTPGPSVSDVHTFELLAEIGVILLMFSIGIEFSLRDLLRVKGVAVVGGPLGIVLTTALAVGVGALLGWPPRQGVVVGLVVSVASTMVLARLLVDRGELHTRHGRVVIGISLVEDLAVVVLLVLMPALGDLSGGRVLMVARGFALAAVILVPFFVFASRVVPALLDRVARARSEELFLLVALAVATGAAALSQAAGLSLALGAFLAGLLISESDHAHETLARLLPIRDIFVPVFFVSLGALLDPRAVRASVPLLVAIVALVVVGKLVVRTAVVALFGHPLGVALRVGIWMTQIGEFSFVLVHVARGAGHVGDDVYQATLAAALLSILINAALVRSAPGWLAGLERGRALPLGGLETDRRARVLVCGFGRVGSAVAEALETFGVPYAAVEVDPEVVRALRARGIPSVLGDASRPMILRAAGASSVQLAVVTLPEFERASLAVQALRRLRPDVPILARAHAVADHDRLREAGATEVIQPEVEAAFTLIRHALVRLALPREQALAYLDRFRQAMDAGEGQGAVAVDALPRIGEADLYGGELVDRSLRDAGIRERFGVTVLSITRANGELVLHPPPDVELRAGDRLRVFGLPAQIDAFRAACASS